MYIFLTANIYYDHMECNYAQIKVELYFLIFLFRFFVLDYIYIFDFQKKYSFIIV